MRITVLLLMHLALSACTDDAPSHVGGALPGEPDIRVRVIRSTDAVQIDADATLQLQPIGANRKFVSDQSLAIAMKAGVWTINNEALPDIGLAPIEVRLIDGGPGDVIRVNGRAYPGLVHLVSRSAGDAPPTRMDVINHIHLEAYLPGVLEREIYSDWHLATFHAQAIAARSYALNRILNAPPTRTFDVESTQASQAYAGATTNPRAIIGVLETTGLVLTHGDQVLPAYYSSTCGGAGLSPDGAFANDEYWPPLQPVAHPAYCRHSRYFEWGPIRRNLVSLGNRMTAWGRQRRHPIRNLRRITDIQISERNDLDRPERFTIVDDRGNAYDLSADEFRTAANSTKAGPLPKKDRLLSGFVELEIRGDQVVIAGRGFGHGIGLCQYGAQQMAEEGHSGRDILATYYPGALIERAY
jgi:stage II sporulation protein D